MSHINIGMIYRTILYLSFEKSYFLMDCCLCKNITKTNVHMHNANITTCHIAYI